MRNYASSMDGCLRYATLVLMAGLTGTYIGGIVAHFLTQDPGALRNFFGGLTALAAAIYFWSDFKLKE